MIHALILAAATLNPYNHCGTERWHVKTLDDGTTHFAARATTVGALVQLPEPAGYNGNNDSTRYAAENDYVTVNALLVGWKEESDRDLHIVIADPNNPDVTMVAEVPDPGCSSVQDGAAPKHIASVRQQFINCFGQPKVGPLQHFADRMVVRLGGVLFFDRDHGQTGRAKVGPDADVEIHPVTYVKTIEGACPK